MSKIVLYQTILFSTNSQVTSIWPIDWTLLGATTPGQSKTGSDRNEVVLCIPQTSSITGASLSAFLVSYTGHSLREIYPSAEMQSVYSTPELVIYSQGSVVQSKKMWNLVVAILFWLTNSCFSLFFCNCLVFLIHLAFSIPRAVW